MVRTGSQRGPRFVSALRLSPWSHATDANVHKKRLKRRDSERTGSNLLTLFRYNWQVRDEWFDWCESVPTEELTRQRTGGVGSILRTLFHVVDVEQAWIRGLKAEADIRYDFEFYASLTNVRELSQSCRDEVEEFLLNWTPDMEDRLLLGTKRDGNSYQYTYGEVLRHVIAHEIHHVGQLSVWARELGREPVTANLIGRRWEL